MKLTSRTGILAGLLVGAVALAACSSSKSGSNNNGNSGSSSSSTSAAATIDCKTGTLGANGSSAQANAVSKWATDYQSKCSGATVNYTATNSGQGVSDFTAGKIGFGGSDSALNPDKGEPAKATKTCGSTALDIPMVTGPIAIAFNVSGVTDLTLTPVLLSKIFFGKITKWNDPAIKAANSGVTLPSTAIKVFFRNDPSGTNKNFEKYLKATDPTDWTFGDPDKPWPAKTGSGLSGSAAVADGVKGADGGIGYMEWSYAGAKGLSVAKIDNGAGAVALTPETAGAFVASATVKGTGNDLTLSIDYAAKTPNAYPIILVTYELVCSDYTKATSDTLKSSGALVKSFLTYTSSDAAQAELPSLGYAPLPASILAKVRASVAAIIA